MISFLVPFHSTESHRETSFRYLMTQLASDWRNEQVLWGSNDGEFNRSMSRNNLAKYSQGEVIVFVDADSYVPKPQIREAVQLVESRQLEWCFPYDQYCSLSEEGTQFALLGEYSTEECDYIFPSEENPEPSHGGCLVVSRRAFNDVGGYDPRFIGWGEEDRAIALALGTLIHPEFRVKPGNLFHFWHPHPESECFEQPHFADNRALCNRYREAERNPEAMRALVIEHT